MAGPLLSAGLSAGASLISGIFGSSSAKRAEKRQFGFQSELDHNHYLRQAQLARDNYAETNKVNDRIAEYNAFVLDNHSENTHWQRDESTSIGSIDFARLVKDSEAAGFNPLTVLRAGGLAGYSTSNVVTTSDMRSKVARDIMTFIAPSETPSLTPGSPAPQTQAFNPIGDALTSGLNAFMNYDRHANERAALEMGLARAQLQNLNSDTAMNNRRFAIPTWTGQPTVRTGGGFAGNVTVGMPSIFEEKTAGITNPYTGFLIDPARANAEDAEARGGEIAGEVHGLLNTLWYDPIYNYRNNKENPPPIKKVTEAATSYFNQAYNAMLRAWNNGLTAEDVQAGWGKL